MAGSDNQLFFTRLLTHVLGNSPPSHTMHAMESLLSPSPSWFTTIVYKPFWLLQVIRAATPFIVRNKDVVVKPCIWNFFSALRSSLRPAISKSAQQDSVGAANILSFLSHEANLIDLGFAAYPAKMKFPGEWDAVKKPLSVAIGDVDIGIKIDTVRDVKGFVGEDGGYAL